MFMIFLQLFLYFDAFIHFNAYFTVLSAVLSVPYTLNSNITNFQRFIDNHMIAELLKYTTSALDCDL